MGFGFNLLFILVLLPLSGLLLLLWGTTQKKEFAKMLGRLWIGVFGLILFSTIVQFFQTKKTIEKKDIYGDYIVDRTKFPGRQADWQYESFRFTISRKNELIFYKTNGSIILSADTAKVEFLEYFRNDRIRVLRDSSMHHIVEKEPSLYREVWSFYYVFKSPKFGNVFFRKGNWEPI